MARKLKLLFFIESLQCGGAEKSLVSLLQLLDYDRVDVDLLTLSPSGVFADYIPDRVNIITMPLSNGPGARMGKAAYSVAWRLNSRKKHPLHNSELRWQLARSSYLPLDTAYDVAIAYQQGLPTYYIASCVNARRKLAWVNIDLEHAGYRKDFVRPYYDKYDHIVAVSQQLADNLLDSGYVDPARLSTIYDILNPAFIREMSLADCITFNRHNAVRIVTVGRMARQKNYPLAVEAARVLAEGGVEFEWIFVGDGVERPLVQSLIDRYGLTDRVVLAGEQPNPYPYMRAAHIYTHTASFEGFGLTIAEAKILGVPVVSTDFRIVHDQITHGVNGLICKMNPESVADNIMRMATDRNLCNLVKRNIAAERNTTADTEIKKFNSLIGLDK